MLVLISSSRSGRRVIRVSIRVVAAHALVLLEDLAQQRLGERALDVHGGKQVLERGQQPAVAVVHTDALERRSQERVVPAADRKSTRLNSSHVKISYAVFCLKKKKL